MVLGTPDAMTRVCAVSEKTSASGQQAGPGQAAGSGPGSDKELLLKLTALMPSLPRRL